MKILVFDNYDSFTYNLVHYVEELTDTDVDVFRNDQIDLSEVERYDKILLSPGPGIPSESGILIPLIQHYAQTKSILGVCLGMQAIVEVFGGEIYNMDTVYHGIESRITVDASVEPMFREMDKEIVVGRYHSWAAKNSRMPAELNITAMDSQQCIMGVNHKTLDVRGVQFHPESVLTPTGKQMIKNWLEL